MGGFDVRGMTRDVFANLIDTDNPAVGVVKKISDNMKEGEKPSDMIRGFAGTKLVTTPGIIPGYINDAFAEAVNGLADAVKSKGMGYRRRGAKKSHKKKSHKRK